MTEEFRDVRHESRFELLVEGMVVYAAYRRRDGMIVIYHVETPRPLRGQGAADRLMTAAVAAIRAEGLKLVPTCSYAAAWMRRHPEHHDLLARLA
ncbi:MAG TPA: GNAT family N-acetyltransferase [Stellaceae bacterium]|nr:GNAT family N-acetyltransferase [Stellaceae bacterium]